MKIARSISRFFVAILVLSSSLFCVKPAFAQLTIGSDGLWIKKEMLFSVNGLEFKPAATMNLSETEIQRSATPVMFSGLPSISQVYTFSAPITFAGVVRLHYKPSALDGAVASDLKLIYGESDDGPLRLVIEADVNTKDKYVGSEFDEPVTFQLLTATAFGITPPEVSDVALVLDAPLQVGNTLTASYAFIDANPDDEDHSTVVWYRYDVPSGDAGKTAIPGATGKSYTLVAADIGKFISFEVTAHDGIVAGPTVESNRQGAVHEQGIRYVKQGATGNGYSWADAAGDLQAMINESGSGDGVWVAAGEYQRGTGESFSMKDGVMIYGGFPSTGTPGVDERDWEGNETVLKGNGASVIRNLYNGVTIAAQLDGFTITGGTGNYYGGGIENRDVSPTLRNLIIRGNTATRNGGGIFNTDANPVMTNLTITGNQAGASYRGGGMYNYQVNAVLTDVTISGNTANRGGGVYSDGSDLTFENVVISGNTATERSGGGMYQEKSTVHLLNTSISGNQAAEFGGAIYTWNTVMSLVNTTVTGNAANTGEGGGIYQTSNSETTLTNSMVWNNSATTNTGSASASVYVDAGGGTFDAAYSLIANSGGSDNWTLGGDLIDGGNNIDADPLFVAAVDPLDAPIADGDFSLQAGSPVINRGDPQTNDIGYRIQAGSSDLPGGTRIFDGRIDIGAYERPFKQQIIDIIDLRFQDDTLAVSYGDADFQPGLTSSSGGAVTFSLPSDAADIAEIVDGSIRIHGVGEVELTIGVEGNAEYDPAAVSVPLVVNKKALTVSLAADPLITKVYDGSDEATLAADNYELSGVLSGETVTVSGTAVYDDKNIGTGKEITVTGFVLDGADHANYVLSTVSATTTGDITARELTVVLSADPLITKVYDGSGAATLVADNYELSSIVSGEVVTVSGTAVYDHKNVGTGITVTVTGFVLDGADHANYTLSTVSATTTGDITARELTVSLSADPPITKVYDGLEEATLAADNYELSGVLSGETVTVSGTAVYDDKNIGTGKEITVIGFVLDGADHVNYMLSTVSATTIGDITARELTVSLSADPLVTKVYNGSDTAILVPANHELSGVLTGETVTVSGTTAVYDDKNIGTGKEITVTGFVLDGADHANYALSTVSATTIGDITARELIVSLSADPLVTKVYDGSDAATLVADNYELSGVVSGEVVTVSGTAVYDDKNTGGGKEITVTGFVLDGADHANYVLSTVSATTIGDITARELIVSLSADPLVTKVYNGSDVATLVPANYELSGVLTGETVTVSGTTAVYDDKNIGTGKEITVTGFVLDGADHANYALSTVSATTTGDITARELTVSLSADPLVTKVYDGSDEATLAAENYELSGVLTGETVTVSGAAVYDNKNVGTGIAVTVTDFVLDGADHANYALSTVSATITGDIMARELTVSLSADPLITKVYDGSDAATLAADNYGLSGVVSGEVVTVSGTAVYDNKNSGTGKEITMTDFVLDGADHANYVLSTVSATTTGDITARELMVSLSADPLVTKVYDGSDEATLATDNYELSGVLSGETVTVSGTAVYDDKNTGAGIAVTVTGFVLDGADHANYVLSTVSATTIGDITARELMVSLSADPPVTKVYNGSDAAILVPANYELSGVLSGETVTVSGTTAVYDDKNIGTGKEITVTGFVLDGADHANYALSTVSATTTGDITARELTVSLPADPLITKVYDGSDAATLVADNYELSGVVSGEVVTVSGTAVYDSKNVGVGIAITVADFVLDGTDFANYLLSTVSATTTGDITARELTVSLSADPLITKVYDGSDAATLAADNYELSGVLSGETVTVSGAAVYDNKNVGTGIAVTVTGFVLDGADHANYALSTVSATTTGDIMTRELTVSLPADPLITKVYDGSDAAMLAADNYELSGVVSGEVVTVSGAAVYDNKNSGTGKEITVTDFVLDGADHANYALSTVSATTTGDIMARELTVSLSADPLITKVYDGSDAATLATDNYELSGILTGETVTVSGTTLYRDKNAGTNKEIWVKDFELGGVDAANYSITTTSTTTTGSITARPLVVSLDASPLITKVYDGTPTATLTAGNYRLDGVIGNDDVTASGSAVYDSEHANKDKTITLAELLLDGNDAGNYTLTTTSGSTTGSITQRPLMIAAAMGQGKQYGEKDPVLAYEATGFAKVEDQHRVVGELSRIPGEDVRTYAIGIGTLTAGPNYTLDYIGADFTITPQTLTVTPDREQGKVYGENDSTLTYTVSGWQFDDSEAVLIGSLSREAGEDAGAYAINGGDLSAGINYTITQAEEVFHIHSAELTVTADGGQHKVYGSDDSVLTYNVTGFKRGDDERIFSGALSRGRGETPGVYGITQGTLAANGNYTVNYSGADFTIQRKPLTVVVNNYPAITKVYDANNAATLVAANYRLEGLVHGSDVTVSGTAVYRDINAGTDKEVWITDFELGGADAANYSIIADTEVMTTGEITPKLLTVSVNTDSPITKIYDGTPTATLAAGHYRLSGIVDADLITVSGTAKYDDSNAGTEKIVTVTDLKLAGPDVSNYILTAVSAITEGRIMPRPLTVTVTAGQGKVYGSDDPALTFEATGFEGDDDERILMGGLERVRGEDVGTYAITQGTLDAGTNYTVDYIGSGFRITPLDVTVTVDGQTKVFGQSDPGLTYGVSPALVGGDGFRGALVREPGEAVGTYAINQGTLALSSNYTLTYNGAELEIKTSSTLTVAFEDRSFVYDGTAKSLSIEGELPAGTSVSYTGNGRTKVGSQTVTATIDGGANYEGLVLTATLDITPGMRTLRFPVLGPKTYGDVDFTPAATASSGEAITYTSSNPAVAEIGDSGLIRIVGAGEAEITATVPENSNYANRPEMSRVLAVGKAMQAITFTAPVEVNRAVGSLQLDVRTSSGLPVYLAIDDGQVATVEGTMLHIHRLGTINITAAQAGDGNHEAAEPVTVTLRVVDPASDFPVRVHPAVSPNGDGINEFLMIEGIRDYPDNRVSVANRNGTIVWEASGYDNDRIAFRGIGPGQQKLPAGTYFYVVEIGTGGGTEYRQGYFVLRY